MADNILLAICMHVEPEVGQKSTTVNQLCRWVCWKIVSIIWLVYVRHCIEWPKCSLCSSLSCAYLNLWTKYSKMVWHTRTSPSVPPPRKKIICIKFKSRQYSYIGCTNLTCMYGYLSCIRIKTNAADSKIKTVLWWSHARRWNEDVTLQ